MPFGDSKSLSTYGNELAGLLTSGNQVGTVRPAQIAANGATVAIREAAITTDLAARVDTPNFILCNLGIVDIGSNEFNDSAARDIWVTKYQTIIDAIHAKWPNARIGILRVWARTYPHLDLMDDTYIPQVIAGRAWASLGPDERDFLENGDDGVTYTSDGVHSNAAGELLTAQEWKTWMGY